MRRSNNNNINKNWFSDWPSVGHSLLILGRINSRVDSRLDNNSNPGLRLDDSVGKALARRAEDPSSNPGPDENLYF